MNEPPAVPSTRLLSLDAYRGLIMISLACNGFGLASTARNHLEHDPGNSYWQEVRHQFGHVEWVGFGYWDMIQPSFMFMVGVAMAFSYLKRQQAGQSYPRMLGHAIWRSLLLIFLGIFLISNHRTGTNWSLVNVLTQIGLGYTFLFLLWGRSFVVQAVAAAGVLIATHAAYTTYPGAGIDLAVGKPEAGVTQKWASTHLEGIAPSWHKNANVGQAIDVVILNWLPRKEPFRFDGGGYQTLNFLPSLATMIFGLMCGELLRSQLSAGRKLVWLVLGGGLGIAAGLVLNETGACPLVKRIWTPAWALFSTGICCWILASFYAVVDVLGCRSWTFPLVVVGVNSIAIYCMGQLLPEWVAGAFRTHFGPDVFRIVGAWFAELFHPSLGSEGALALGRLWQPTTQTVLVGLTFWLVCFWMYRKKIFLRI